MREGVIATDMDQRVISINPAAARMFDVPMETVGVGVFWRSFATMISRN
jgi:PAS domain-containing protein